MNEILRDYMLLYRHIDWETCAVWCLLFVFLILFWGGVAVLFLR